MKTISDIYVEQHIIRNLQEHQLRVAAVAKQICDAQPVPVKIDVVVRACLLHDMANILKFDFTSFPEFFEPEGKEYWQKIQQDVQKTYGSQEHAATLQIAREVGVDQTVIDLMDGVGFSHISATLHSQSMERKICCYADMRVGPWGVISVADRLADGKKRYANRPDHSLDPQVYERLVTDLYILEQAVFAQAKIQPADITDQSIQIDLQRLRSFSL